MYSSKNYNGGNVDLFDLANLDYTGKTILDVGCYRGINAKYLKDKYNNVTFIGLEYNADAIKSKYNEADFVYQVNLDEFDPSILKSPIGDQ
jgi:cyclopropane fatty-acyl-phospholipid synthase-like methyltransferase